MNDKKKLAACLQEMGLLLRMGTFSERKKMQKLGYLLKVFGVEFNFSFNWYLHGPYSPDLTRILFDLVETISVAQPNLNKEDSDKIKQLQDFLDDDINSSDRLELLVSIHYLKKLGIQYNASDDEIRAVLKEKKPFFSDHEIERCWQKIEKLY